MDDAFFSAAETKQIRAPLPMIPQCGACKLDRGCKSPKMPVDGDGRRKILIVGEQPGRDEDIDGRPLVGPTGKMLTDKLRRLGVNMRKDCWLTNALICKPNGNAHDEAVAQCRPNLMKTIRTLNPESIILLGGDAVRSLIGYLWKPNTGGIKRWVGWQIPSIQLNTWIFPTYQPAALFYDRDPVADMDFTAHLAAAVATTGRPFPDGPPDYERRIQTILDPQDAADWLTDIRDGVIAFDYETNMKKPDHRDAQIVCASVCHNGVETIAFPWYGPVKSAMQYLLTDPNVAKIGANIKFEDRWTRAKLGVSVVGWCFDTMLGAHLLNPRGGKDGKDDKGKKEESGITGLKFQAFVKLGVGDYNHHIEPFLHSTEKGGYVPNRIAELAKSSMPLLLKYCGLDSLLEYELAQRQMDELGM